MLENDGQRHQNESQNGAKMRTDLLKHKARQSIAALPVEGFLQMHVKMYMQVLHGLGGPFQGDASSWKTGPRTRTSLTQTGASPSPVLKN